MTFVIIERTSYEVHVGSTNNLLCGYLLKMDNDRWCFRPNSASINYLHEMLIEIVEKIKELNLLT